MACAVFVPAMPLSRRPGQLASSPFPARNCRSRHIPIRRAQTAPSHTPLPTAVLETDRPNSETDPEPSVSRLRQEHLDAYFDADESTYQTRLSGVARLALQNFAIELGELQTAFCRMVGLDPPLRYTPPECLNFQLSSEAVANRERERDFAEGEIAASPFVRFVYEVTCQMLDLRFEGRPVPRFWFLETVARMPYFAYTSCLHLLSTLGWYRSPTLMNMHHAEELNEAYHLAVMESLGGDKRWGDRFLAFHASIAYYWYLVILFFISPAESYRFSRLIETHAVDTYAEFVEANEDLLRSLPAPDVAHEYYAHFMYYFYEFQLSSQKQPSEQARRPEIDSLLDVFQNILLDEREHARTMTACTDYIEKGDQIWYNGKCVSGSSRRPNTIPTEKRQEFWRKWSKLQDEENGLT